MRTVVCIPTYNERENLPALVEEILDISSADVMVLDDASPDGTGEEADRLAAKDARVTVVHRSAREGIGAADLDGFRRALEAGYDVVVQMDGDFSHQPRHLPALLAALDEGADVAIGSRYVGGAQIPKWSARRRALSRAGNVFARAVFRMPQLDLTSGFTAFRRHVLEAIELESVRPDSYAFQLELKYRAYRRGFTLVEVPIVFFDRVVGASKLESQKLAEAVVRVFDLRIRGAA